MHPLDLDRWSRRHHFEFFRRFEQPFFNVCAPVDVGRLAALCRRPGGPSFFLSGLWLSLAAANEVEEMRLRLAGDGVVVHDLVHGGSTVLRDDETFGFAYFDFDPDFARFAAAGERVLAAARAPGPLEARPERHDLIHYSVLPWLAFTSFQHARRRDPGDSVPKIVFGRYRDAGGGRLEMPVSVELHHALADGLHAARFFERFQERLDDPEAAGVRPG